MDNTSNNNINDSVTRSQPVTTDLRFAQINLHHCNKASYTYCRDLKINNTDISLIQEPWIRGNKIHGFGQLHNRLFYCRTGGKPRAAIHVSPNINALVLNQFTDNDLVAVRICRKATEGDDFIVVSAYMPYDSQEPPPGSSLTKLMDFCELEKIPLVIGADSNSHHTVWGSSDINKRGEELLQFLVTTDLMIQNIGIKPTFVNAVREERLDITLTSCSLSDLVHSWRVTDEETFSDHKLIKFCLRGQFPQREPFRNPKKTNWDQYREIL